MSPTGSPVPKWTGKALAAFPSIPPCPSQGLPQGLPCPHWTPNCGCVLLGVGTPSLPQPPLRGAGPGGLAFTFALPSLPLLQDPRSWKGPRWAEDQAWDPSWLLGAHVGRGNLAKLPFDPLPSQWSPNFLLRAWDPFPSQPPLRGAGSIPPPLLVPPHSPS